MLGGVLDEMSQGCVDGSVWSVGFVGAVFVLVGFFNNLCGGTFVKFVEGRGYWVT